ncbi:MAG: asparagine synthase (glutamine-hydrolyzing) [Daejeonella sp.]|uniref:asparagine synthase (glutamine-hydrolyzing) n=1 Tax=Daejeonella sp. TaxID=2805397 RepID=UPI003C78013F
MCGIAGFIDKSKVSGQQELAKMTAVLAHRGPDGKGLVVLDDLPASVGLGHRRLSIIDLHETGSQPMFFGDWSIVFNGEIYNYGEIKSSLEKIGRVFKSHSDTEVILQSFDEWGLKAVDLFIGMFAFVIVNHKRQKAWFFRDRPGVKPFYYYSEGKLMLFASELKAFHEHPGFKKEIDQRAVAQFMQFGYIKAPMTIFKNAFKLKPGHYIEFNISTFQFKEHPYWRAVDYYNQPKMTISDADAISETEKLMQSAVEYRMVADVPVGVFLSGGYDSSTVAALLQHNRTEKLKTFSIGFNEAGFDEAPFAKKVAAYLGTDHTEYYCTSDDARNLIPEIPEHWDEPFADPSSIPTMLVSKLAREKVTVALSADAGDELFGGYSKYTYILNGAKRNSVIPKQLRHAAADFLGRIDPGKIPYFNKTYNFQTRYYKGIELLKAEGVMDGLSSVAKFFSDTEIDSLVNGSGHSIEFFGNMPFIDEQYEDDLSNLLYSDYQTYMVDDILTKVDRATMSVSLEGREPLLDHRLLEWSARLPSDLKIRNGEKKYILKEICHKYLPKEMMARPKMGFGIPIVNWFDSEISGYVRQFLNETYVRKQGIFNVVAVNKIVSRYLKNKRENVFKLWNLIMFQVWYERWMK